jgi:tetratricopeptide (TPR) repeat protein
MHKTNQAIQAGYAAFQRGDFAEARRRLRRIKHPKAVHLLGLVEKGDGNLREAMQLLRRAAALDSRDPEIANNLARTAQDLGDLDTAESEYRRALKIQANLRPAMVGLCHLLVKLERWPEAYKLFEQLLPASPNDPSLRHGFAMTLLGMGQPEKAEPMFTALVEEGNTAPQIRYMRARARLELGIVDPAIDDLRAAHAAKPSILTLQSLAGMYWMTGDKASLETLVQEAINVPELVAKAAEILRQTGSPEKALAALYAARAKHELPPASWAVEATVFIDMQDGARAEEAARECLVVDPQNVVVRRSLITSLLMQGKASDAMPIIEDMRKKEPDDQQWLAYETTALRLLGDTRYADIVDIERFVRPYKLPVPEGFDNIESFNSAFLLTLDRWHRYETHPLDQSLRGGSQTPRDLTTIDDPVIKAFYRALDDPIRRYMSTVGNAQDHPLTARNTGDYQITGGWSVRLQGGGKHVNHVHPEGWISSAYYFSVPEETRTDPGRSGWIKFAEPPFETSPPTPPEKWIQPEAGMLVLFPSYLWHGTEPIHDGSLRVTAPFDAVPA